jgi:hypothetical protein
MRIYNVKIPLKTGSLLPRDQIIYKKLFSSDKPREYYNNGRNKKNMDKPAYHMKTNQADKPQTYKY